MTNILIIDDSPEDREWLTDMAEQTGGFTIRSAGSGRDGIASVKDTGADCVLLDHRLGGEDGLDVLAALKELAPFIPVIMMTGQGTEEVAAQSIKTGAADYLVKQRLTRPHLLTAIENAMHRAVLEAKVADQEMQRRQFLDILVKDLRAPLENILQLGDMAADVADGGDPEEIRDLLKSQRDVTVRAVELIATLENYALLDSDVAFGPVSLTDVAEAARDNLATVIQDRRAEVTVFDMPVVSGSRSQLTQLFQNLIENGLKHNTSKRPQILISAESGDEDEVTLVVNDNGVGISAEDLSSIFDPLKRVDADERNGVGLGLSICRKIVERHGGKIWCRSTEGQGSDFSITLPVAARPH